MRTPRLIISRIEFAPLQRRRSKREAKKWAAERLTCGKCGQLWDFNGNCGCK